MRQQQMIRRLLYSLKRDWGATFEYVQILESELNLNTGSREVHRKAYQIPGVLLPQNQVRKFIQDIGYLAADKNFTYGAMNDFNTLKFLFLKDDVPPGVLDLNGYIVYNGKRYERVELGEMQDTAILLLARGVEGAVPYSTIEKGAHNTLQIGGRVTVELN